MQKTNAIEMLNSIWYIYDTTVFKAQGMLKKRL